MTTLAINGGKPEVQGPLPRYQSVTAADLSATRWLATGEGSMSGYLGGQLRGGKYVCRLEDKWAEAVGSKYAVACNSATSGLMAAAFAVGLSRGDRFGVSPYTMSATAAAPSFTRAHAEFLEIEDKTFCVDPENDFDDLKAVFVTSLFGHPAPCAEIMHKMDLGQYIIDDCAQAPFAMVDAGYAGTQADIGVFSLNVHKHLQCGEGGICVTDDGVLAQRMRLFINHGEMISPHFGLNLRMTELAAVVALQQLARRDELIGGRIEQAQLLLEAIGNVPGINPPVNLADRHVYYALAFTVDGPLLHKRHELVEALCAEGVPLCEGYVKPLYHLPVFDRLDPCLCPVAESLHNERLFYFENCAWSPTKDQIAQIGCAFQKVAETLL